MERNKAQKQLLEKAKLLVLLFILMPSFLKKSALPLTSTMQIDK